LPVVPVLELNLETAILANSKWAYETPQILILSP
jgi:hypothetical protein